MNTKYIYKIKQAIKLNWVNISLLVFAFILSIITYVIATGKTPNSITQANTIIALSLFRIIGLVIIAVVPIIIIICLHSGIKKIERSDHIATSWVTFMGVINIIGGILFIIFGFFGIISTLTNSGDNINISNKDIVIVLSIISNIIVFVQGIISIVAGAKEVSAVGDYRENLLNN